MQKTFIIIFIISFSLFISCKDKSAAKPRVLVKKAEDDTKDLELEILKDTLYPVYNLTGKTTAIVLTMFDTDSVSRSKFEKIYSKINDADSLESDFYKHPASPNRKFEYYDTLGIVQLIKSKKLEKEIKKIIAPKYYVYGTKGFAEMTVDEVVCRIDDCRENFIGLTIKNFDTAKNGKPLFCSTKPIKLNYGKNYFATQRKIQKIDDSIVYRYSDLDSVKTKVFANIGPAYFIYNDDFLWGRNVKQSKCLFPGRRIIIQKKDNSFKTIYVQALDLFGMACD
ncbi:hypothetical protein [Flavobacterium pectinovorum]|uniref:Uncharacterized protein n=1 Tax=Flavobacterium pectinovorum TaxID=29533 RepID=A0A502F793_9FLAO|nr:hypothetical protein [Flavobacterium pectinovorum]TPG45234.1 hypothetical protein EAH81_01120 [Flavobacterium pectinovorum]